MNRRNTIRPLPYETQISAKISGEGVTLFFVLVKGREIETTVNEREMYILIYIYIYKKRESHACFSPLL